MKYSCTLTKETFTKAVSSSIRTWSAYYDSRTTRALHLLGRIWFVLCFVFSGSALLNYQGEQAHAFWWGVAPWVVYLAIKSAETIYREAKHIEGMLVRLGPFPVTVEIDLRESEASFKYPYMENVIPWGMFLRAISGEEMVIVASKPTLIFLPSESFSTPEEKEAFVREINEKITANNSLQARRP